MRVLALDTTTRAGSVAIVDDGRVVDERGGDASRTHAERLPGEILALADANQTPLASVDLFAVASGPGSFTGLRIGIATLQGIAFVQGRKMVGVPALEALAQHASSDLPAGARVAAWMDAHRRDVFAALYRVTGAPMFDPDRLVEHIVRTMTDQFGAHSSSVWRKDEPGGPIEFEFAWNFQILHNSRGRRRERDSNPNIA